MRFIKHCCVKEKAAVTKLRFNILKHRESIIRRRYVFEKALNSDYGAIDFKQKNNSGGEYIEISKAA